MFGIDVNTLALSPAQILSDEINRKQLALAEKRLALEERSLTLRSIPTGGGGGRGTRRVSVSQGVSDPIADVRASFGLEADPWGKRKEEMAEKTKAAQEAQAKRREDYQKRQAQGKLAEQYGAAGFVPKAPKGWEKKKEVTPWGKSGITTSARSKILGALKGGKYKSEFGMTLPLTNQKQAIDFVQRYGHLNYKEDPGIMEIIGSLPTGREKKKKRGWFFKEEQPDPMGKWWLD